MADLVSGFVGTWKFILLYTFSMIIWINLHLNGVLSIDSDDFMKWNLWLSYFAGIQASILLMSAEKQAKIDRTRDESTHNIAKKNLDRLTVLVKHIELIEDVIEDLAEGAQEKDNERPK